MSFSGEDVAIIGNEIGVLQLEMFIGVGKAQCLPSLRTARAVFSHTALQSVVSSSGVFRILKGRF
jgi:hypothetical protein